jgi:glycosyltransferase involved in cell wall biosynthesis
MSELRKYNLTHEEMQYFHLPWEDDPSLKDTGLTIVHPFYNEKERLELQWERWERWSSLAKRKVKVIIADDCSDPGIHTFIPGTPLIDLAIFRVKQDLRHNTPGCLNMGIKEANTEWLLIMDSDCMLEPERLDWLLQYKPTQDFVLRFHRDRITKNPKHNKHRILGCSILFSKTQWRTVGGFDEDFTGESSGGYGYFDNDFNRKLTQNGYRKAVPIGLHVTEYLDDVIGRPGVQAINDVTKEKEHNINKHLYYDKRQRRVPESPFSRICRFQYERTY